MGANAQTTVPTFTAGQVLTAAQQNASARTGVPVFASTVTRDAAFGGTGEKTLAEGQMCYVEGTGLQTYNGTAWVTWGAAPSSGLNFVTGATFTTATTVSLPNSTFTSSYRNYRVMFNITTIANDANLTMRLRASGTDNATGYDTGFYGITNNNSLQSWTTDNGTAWNMAQVDNGAILNWYYLSFDIFGPQTTTFTSIVGQFSYVRSDASAIGFVSGGGSHRTAAAYDAVTLISSAASNLTGTYRVYGYADS